MKRRGQESGGSNKKFIYVKALCTKVKGILPDFGKAQNWIQVRIWKIPLTNGYTVFKIAWKFIIVEIINALWLIA